MLRIVLVRSVLVGMGLVSSSSVFWLWLNKYSSFGNSVKSSSVLDFSNYGMNWQELSIGDVCYLFAP